VPVRPGLANRPGLLHPDFVFVLHPTRNTRIERVRRRKEVAAGESDRRLYLKEADEGSFGEFCSYSRSRLFNGMGKKTS